MEAVNAGDAATIESLTALSRGSDGSQSRARTRLACCIELQRELERAVAARWGDDAAKSFGGPFMSFTEADRAAVTKAKVDLRLENFEALIVTGPGVAPIALRWTRSDEQWKVIVRMVSTMFDGSAAGRQAEENTAARLKYLLGVERSLFHVAWRVREKRIESAEAARKELDDSIKRAADPDSIAMEPTEKAEANERLNGK
jgi:hypothetical protein